MFPFAVCLLSFCPFASHNDLLLVVEHSACCFLLVLGNELAQGRYIISRTTICEGNHGVSACQLVADGDSCYSDSDHFATEC